MRFGPGFRRHARYLAGGHVRQAGQHFSQIGVGIDVPATATFDQSVNDGAALAGFFGAEEQPVLFADGRGPDGIFHQVMPLPILCRARLLRTLKFLRRRQDSMIADAA